ncbi:MAG TPA: bifunctional protein-serine/threonine kinase/phosphatase [Thauera sp.]|uniref:bifunctional protein-serine/threonine kinase/phosphatase n=1 Tax=Thauera sp. TaxID=1905334 RepID=UPI002C5B5BD9|nr:bifunctional protein-serine/threonine kinase/phosphatase [Thauera sp.]HRP23033.1 bifunctional protein-serine/threonine kinase/phosphatase [Thauera sp.]HRP64480.1 bifunctional protein-serine/threonine kinase/phosphatase [Thauera sp.]
MPGLQVSLGHASAQGPRPRNEDFVGAATPEGEELEAKGMLLAVADGVGGHAHGREAAEQTVRSLLADYFSTPQTWSVDKSVDTVLGAVNRWLLGQSAKAREYAGMATTLTAVVLRGRRYHVAHVGDSRAYRWRAGELLRLTEDHTWAHPEFDNVLRRAIGLEARLLVDHDDGELAAGDRFVLVTDGVWTTLGDAGIAAVLLAQADAQQAADALAQGALRRGATDNATALVANVEALPADKLRDRLADGHRLPLPPRLKPGQTLDGLRVEEVLHESRLTLLYRVTRLAGGEALVLKTLRPEADDDEAVGALVREEWLARRVPGKGFPRVCDHPRAHLYYLMSWHEGETLKASLARGHRFEAHELVGIGRALLRRVAVLHRLGIVHRDIKPDNVHIDRSGELRLLDLGVAAADAEDLAEINNPGTPSYMAPELFAGGQANESSDLYACGVTLYELLTRKYPYGEIEPFQHPRFGAPVPPTRYRPDTPEWLESVLLKACAREPQDRFETAEEFLLALERGASRPLATRRRVPLLERNPRLALKIVAALSLALNLVLLYLLSRH